MLIYASHAFLTFSAEHHWKTYITCLCIHTNTNPVDLLVCIIMKSVIV